MAYVTREAFRSWLRRGMGHALLALCACGALSCAQSRQSAAPEPDATDAPDAGAADRLTEDEYYRVRAGAECATARFCCERAGLRVRSDCTEQLEPKLRSWLPDPDSGARFDPEAAAECVAGFAAAECVPLKRWRSDPPACNRVYTRGRVPLGARCTNSPFECASIDGEVVNCSPTRATEPYESICVISRTLDEGERCVEPKAQPNTEAYCRRPLFCDEQRGVCVLPAARGESCITGSFYGDTCAVGSVCDRFGSKRCVEPTPIGATCDPNTDRCEGIACIEGQCREAFVGLQYCE